MRITLEVQDGPDAGRRIRLPETGSIRVGRSEEVDFRLRDGFLSQKHFAIEVRDGKCHLRDLNSRNGTFLKGEKISEADLQSGSQIHAGHTAFLLRIEGKAQAPSSGRRQSLLAMPSWRRWAGRWPSRSWPPRWIRDLDCRLPPRCRGRGLRSSLNRNEPAITPCSPARLPRGSPS